MTDGRSGPAAPLASIVGVVAASALVPLNSTMIAVALPAISDDFDVTTAEVSVLVTLYLVIMLVGQPIAGRVADSLGTRRTVRFALAGLASFSLLAAFAGSFAFLLVARCLQAVCAAALAPGAQSLLRSMAAPGEQGRVFGILGSANGAGAAAGPVVGGLLIQAFDWRGIFVINVPIVLLAMVATRAAPADRAGSVRPTAASSTDRIFNSVFVAGYSAQALTTQTQYALLLITPLILDARGWSAGEIGFVLSALTVGMMVNGPVGGRVGDARGRRLPAMIGIGFAGAATILLLVAGPAVDPVVLTIGLAVFGLGLGAATPNFMSAALGSVSEARTGSAAGILTTSRYVGSISTTVMIAAWVTNDGSGMRSVLTVSVVCMALGLLAASGLESRSRPTPAAGSALTSSDRPARPA